MYKHIFTGMRLWARVLKWFQSMERFIIDVKIQLSLLLVLAVLLVALMQRILYKLTIAQINNREKSIIILPHYISFTQYGTDHAPEHIFPYWENKSSNNMRCVGSASRPSCKERSGGRRPHLQGLGLWSLARCIRRRGLPQAEQRQRWVLHKLSVLVIAVYKVLKLYCCEIYTIRRKRDKCEGILQEALYINLEDYQGWKI